MLDSKKNKIIKYINDNYEYKDVLIKYIKDNEIPFDDDTFFDIVKILDKNKLYNIDEIYSIKQIYDVIVYNKEQYNLFLEVLPLYSKLFRDGELINIYYLFSDKQLFLRLCKTIENSHINDIHTSRCLYNYILSSRKYYIDEISYFTTINEAIIKINNIILFKEEKELIDSYLEEKLKEDRKIAGVYEVDEDKLELYEKQIKDLEAKISELQNKFQSSENIINNFLERINSIITETNSNVDESLKKLKDYASEIKNSINNPDENSNLKKTYNPIKATEICDKIFSKIKNDDLTLEQNNAIYQKLYDKVLLSLEDSESNELSKLNIDYFEFYYVALINETTYYLDEILNVIPFDRMREIYIHKDVVNILKKDEYLKLLKNKFDIIVHYNDSLNAFKFMLNCIKINPDFNSEYKLKMIKDLIDVFGYDTLANASEIFVKNVSMDESYDYFFCISTHHLTQQSLLSYKTLYEINPYIVLVDAEFLHLSCDIQEDLSNNDSNVAKTERKFQEYFSLNDLAFFSKKQQKAYIIFHRFLRDNYLKNCDTLIQKFKDIIYDEDFEEKVNESYIAKLTVLLYVKNMSLIDYLDLNLDEKKEKELLDYSFKIVKENKTPHSTASKINKKIKYINQ